MVHLFEENVNDENIYNENNNPPHPQIKSGHRTSVLWQSNYENA